MSIGQRCRISRNLQRLIRARQRETGESYMAAAHVAMAELARGRHYLADPVVPAAVAADVRAGRLLPLEAFTAIEGWDWWCRCLRCGIVVSLHPWNPRPGPASTTITPAGAMTPAHRWSGCHQQSLGCSEPAAASCRSPRFRTCSQHVSAADRRVSERRRQGCTDQDSHP